MELIRRAEHDRLHVPKEKFRADVVRPYGNDFLAEIQGVKRLDHTLPALRPLKLVGACILEIHHHMIDRRLDRVGCVLVELHTVTRVGQLGAGNHETLASIDYEHRFLLK